MTGANSGIGKATAAALADMGARVILACRSEARANAAIHELMRTPHRDLRFLPLDLADLDSVRAFASAFVAEYSSLDVLINNAGLLARGPAKTKQGFESSFGVNYLGHFLLTLLLLPPLMNAEQGRIVMMSSLAHAWNDVNFDDVSLSHGYDRFRAYGQSKLCNLLFTRVAAQKLNALGARVTINAVHPGVVASNIVVNRRNNSLWWVANLSKLVLLSPEKGADTSVYLASDPSLALVSGEYFHKRKIALSSPASHDMETAERLYRMSLGFVGLADDPLAAP